VRPLKFLIGLCLLPLVYASVRTLIDLALSLQPASMDGIPLTLWGLCGGFALWLFLFFAAPRPMRTYVLAHELTHALWGAGMGARVSRLRVSDKGGSVRLSKTNFLITLAPYFFPLYTVLVILAYYVLLLFFELNRYEPFWLACIGFTWGFHLTFTVSMLLEHQSDIHEHGRIFSFSVILLFNVLGLCLWIVMVSSPTLGDVEAGVRRHLADVMQVVPSRDGQRHDASRGSPAGNRSARNDGPECCARPQRCATPPRYPSQGLRGA